MTTLFLGGEAHEVLIDGQSSTVTKYYAIAEQRVMRDSNGFNYIIWIQKTASNHNLTLKNRLLSTLPPKIPRTNV